MFFFGGVMSTRTILHCDLNNFFASVSLLDKPELSANEAITDSRMMMRGHKMELFLLDLSFIGWILLSILTFGILFIYVVPYMQAARAEFYRTLKGENEPKADEPIIEIPH